MQHLGVKDCHMTSSAATKWSCLDEDERAALNYAFYDAIMHIRKVAEYRFYLLRLQRGIVHMHWFRIGHAIFEMAIFRNCPPIITDIAWVT
jgi:hypothetical protein